MSNSYITSNTPSKRKYGGWTDSRLQVLVDSMIAYHPFDRKKLEIAKAKQNVMKSVNEIDRHVNEIGSWNTFQIKVDTLIKEVTRKRSSRNAYGTGSKNSQTYLDNRVMELKKMMENNKQLAGEALVELSMRGEHPIGTRTNLNQLDFSATEEAAENAENSREMACLDSTPGLNRGIKRTLENLEEDRLEQKALVIKLVNKVQSLEDKIEQLSHHVLNGALPPRHPVRPIARNPTQTQDNNTNK